MQFLTLIKSFILNSARLLLTIGYGNGYQRFKSAKRLKLYSLNI